MATRRINGEEGEALFIIGGIALLYFGVIKPIIGAFEGNPEDQKNISDQANQAPVDNFFNPQYQPFVYNFEANQPTDENGNPLSLQQFFILVKKENDNGTPVIKDSNINIAQMGEDLRNDLSAWNIATDPNEVLSVFAPITNKTEVSSLAAYLFYNYGKDLLTMLKGSIFKEGLSQTDLSALITKLNALPD